MTEESAISNQDIKNRLERMEDGEVVDISGVNVRKDGSDWWIQAGGGVQYTSSLRRAARLVRELAAHLDESKSFGDKEAQEEKES